MSLAHAPGPWPPSLLWPRPASEALLDGHSGSAADGYYSRRAVAAQTGRYGDQRVSDYDIQYSVGSVSSRLVEYGMLRSGCLARRHDIARLSEPHGAIGCCGEKQESPRHGRWRFLRVRTQHTTSTSISPTEPEPMTARASPLQPELH